MKNEIWKTIGISALTSVIVFLVLYFASGQVLLSPTGIYFGQTQTSGVAGMPSTYPPQHTDQDGSPAEINANRCQADGVCETNDLTAAHITTNKLQVDSIANVKQFLSVENPNGTGEMRSNNFCLWNGADPNQIDCISSWPNSAIFIKEDCIFNPANITAWRPCWCPADSVVTGWYGYDCKVGGECDQTNIAGTALEFLHDGKKTAHVGVFCAKAQ